MTKKIHVMQVLHSLEIGGAEKLAYDIAANFDSSFTFSFACLDSIGFLGDKIIGEGGNVYCLHRNKGLDFKVIKQFASLLTEKKVDIVHAHQYTPYFYSVLASVFSSRRPKVIFTEHGRHQPDKVRWKRVVFNTLFLPFTHKYTGVARFSKDSLVAFEKIPANRIDVIYNGIDLTRFPKNYDKNTVRKELELPVNRPLIGIIARLDPIKDHKTLIDAVGLLKTEISAVVLLIVGDGPTRPSLENQVKKAGLENNVVFVGMRTDVPQLLMALDVFVLPSIMEAMSVTLLEAMSAQIPVIATDVGGNREVVIAGETGELVPVNDPETLARSLKTILADKTQSRKMGIAGRKRVEEFFTFTQMIDQYKNMYLTLMNR